MIVLSSPGDDEPLTVFDSSNGDGDGSAQSKAENQVNLNQLHNPHDSLEVDLDSIERKASEMNLNQKARGFKRRYSRRELEELRFANLEEQQRAWKRVCLRLGSFVAEFANIGSEGEQQLDKPLRLSDMGEEDLLKLLSANVSVTANENWAKRRYPRSEMECLRFVNVEDQQRVWNEVYLRLGPVVGKEYDRTVHSKPQKQPKKKNSGKKKQNNYVSGEGFDTLKGDTTLHLPCSSNVNSEVSDGRIAMDECNEDIENESEDEFDSIQKPAFLVEGDPDFDSGPPQDGLEYLRRVRWETAQIPKVKVAKLEKINLNTEQSAYMPIIPDIAKCSEHLLPSKLWEDAFLTDFTELRLALARLDILNQQRSDYQQKHFNFKEDNSKLFSGDPMLSTVLGMDVVSRTSALKSHIRSFEDMSTLTRSVCAWLYALCAVVDTPLDADTGASLRCLLRKCAKLRSEKSDCDDEVTMLNILVTVSGRYFGQSES